MAKCRGRIRTCRECGIKWELGLTGFECPTCGASLHCERDTTYATSYCPKHGGGVPRRGIPPKDMIGSKHGKVSKFKLVRLAAKYEEALNDPELLSMRKPLAIIEARLDELLERLDDNYSPERFQALHSAFKEYKKARGTQFELQAFVKLDNAFEEAYHDYEAWKQIIDLFDTRRKLSEAEIKRLKEMQQVMTAEDAYELVAKIFAAARRALQDDPRKLGAFQNELIRLVGDDPRDPDRFAHEEADLAGPGRVDREELLDSRT